MNRPGLMHRFRPLSEPGLLIGTLFFAFSLGPSLIPRPAVFQGLVSGLSIAVGYGIGTAGRWLWAYLELPFPGKRLERVLIIGAGAICVGVAAVFLRRASEWQNSVRALMEMEPVDGVRLPGIALMALLIFAAVLWLARLFRRLFHFLSLRLRRFLPRRVSNLIGVVLAIALFGGIINGVILRTALRVADGVSQRVDAIVPEESAAPTDPARSGSEPSLIAWRDLGRQGREFVSGGPTAADLAAFFGEPTPAPIRVYVGLNSAETAEARARLAVRELERVGAFERSVLLLVTPTGTGWIDPAAANTIEYLHRGDIATVAVQYSYLPSVLALMVEGAYPAEAAQAAFRAVYDHWTELPRETRPALYLHGVSLGALNSERSFDLHDILADPLDGALWSGPPFRSETWSQITAGREPLSPAWLPRFRDGSVVRVMNQDGGLEAAEAEWGPGRIAFLQYGSDPMTYFSARSFFREPEWMRGRRAPDVSPELRWYPAVTMLQLVADMAVSQSPPPGYGHNFAAEHYIDAWLALTEPAGWPAEEVRRLKSLFRTRPPAS